jgi:hypothetical protein
MFEHIEKELSEILGSKVVYDGKTIEFPEGILKAAGEPMFKFLKVDKKQQIVGGIIYEPNVEDTQGDWTTGEEIEKAMYKFMIAYAQDTKKIKVMHKGRTRHFPILESFITREDMKIGEGTVKKGSWWMMVKIDDPDVWADVDAGKLAGFSMGGRSSGKQASPPAR